MRYDNPNSITQFEEDASDEAAGVEKQEKIPEHFAKSHYESSGYESRMEEKPVIRMSKLLQPIAVQRQKIDYLERVDGDTWFTVDTQYGKQNQGNGDVRYTLNQRHIAPQQPRQALVAANGLVFQNEEMPVQYERENLDILELLRNHTNRSTS